LRLCAPLSTGLVLAAGAPSAAGRPGPALVLLPARPVVELLCAQAIDDTPAKSAAVTVVPITIRGIISSGVAVARSVQRHKG
jgi:hypothetical protein